MKEFVKRSLVHLALNEFSWTILKPFSIVGFFIVSTRLAKKRKIGITKAKLESLVDDDFFKNIEVQSGPFKGLKYPDIDSVGSMIYPKLLGSYEKELWDVLKEMIGNDYTEIIDVGCAEGYYAIGLGTIKKNARIYAYDTSEKARYLCKKMAILNKIEDRVNIKTECTAKELGSFKFTGKGLIISDCEGFEKELFNMSNIHNFSNCDLIIETHDFIDINISTYIKDVFINTHHITSIKSKDDIEKALTYEVKGLESVGLQIRKQLLSECRPAIMEWIICKPKRE
jgi:hypothetical protein